ncbi:MAG: heat-inducible transcription repressor HrcA [Chloroflexi bacterium]|nr:heat-inducible transcription repressor HrcA [Chloroflexota bacterium]
MLTDRQSSILEFVIGEYVETAEPVGSRSISRRRQVDVSPATIRNEMAELESQGYLSHRHTSSGRVPTAKGYRFFVESLMLEEQLPWEIQQTIRHQFHQGERGQEARAHLAASVLAQTVENAAVVTAPRTEFCRVKHLELVSLHDLTALLVLVLDEGRLEQQIVTLEEPRTQDELTGMAGKLNQLFAGTAVSELAAIEVELTPMERHIIDAVEAMMRTVDEGGSEGAYLEGLRNVLSQPEFAEGERALGLLELLDERNLTRAIPLRALAREGVSVIIGADNPNLAEASEAMRACSVVIGAYGAPGVASGVLAVLGPTRMRYPRTISTVRYLANVMSELLSEHYD